MSRLRTILIGIRSSLWFVPAGMVFAAITLAFGLVELDSRAAFHLDQRLPRFFGAGPDGARALLAAIATSMVTVAGVSFSMTMVALSLAANQFSSRVLRNFMRDRSNQVVLGTFISIFVYCLVVLRTIRGGEGAHVPSVSVAAAICLALVGIGFLIFFIHHVAATMQVSGILASISKEALGALVTSYPQELGQAADLEPAGSPRDEALLDQTGWQPVPARCSGYVQTVELEALVRCAARHDVIIRMECMPGDFVGCGTRLASASAIPGPRLVRDVNSLFGISYYRSIEQDPSFGIRQIVDIALKALSPGVNDPTTAVNCLDRLELILRLLVGRRIPSPLRYDRGELRLIVRFPTFEFLLDEALHEIRSYGRGHIFVVRRIQQLLANVGEAAGEKDRRELLLQHGRALLADARDSLSSADWARVAQRQEELESGLLGGTRDTPQAQRERAKEKWECGEVGRS